MLTLRHSSFRTAFKQATLAIATTIAGASAQSSVELLVNGGFETGDFSGWNSVAGTGAGHVVQQGSPLPNGFMPNTPRSGMYLFSSSTLEGAVGGTLEISLEQVVSLPACVPPSPSGFVRGTAFVSGSMGLGGFSSDDTAQLCVEFLSSSGQVVGTAASPVIDPPPGVRSMLSTGVVAIPAQACTIRYRYRTLLDLPFMSIDIGADDLSLELLQAVTASCTLRNGSGVNPIGYSCTNTPVLGTNWTTTIATAGSTIATTIAIAGASATLPFQGGEILFDPSTAIAFLNGTGVHVLSIPASPGLLGSRFVTQGFRVDLSGSVLTLGPQNALDLLLGT